MWLTVLRCCHGNSGLWPCLGIITFFHVIVSNQCFSAECCRSIVCENRVNICLQSAHQIQRLDSDIWTLQSLIFTPLSFPAFVPAQTFKTNMLPSASVGYVNVCRHPHRWGCNYLENFILFFFIDSCIRLVNKPGLADSKQALWGQCRVAESRTIKTTKKLIQN